MESTVPIPAEPRPGGDSPRRPDVDFLPDPLPMSRRLELLDPVGYQHLMVNPLLGMAALIGWGGLVRRLLASPEPPLALAACLLLAFVPFLIHYHCLDCGGTGLWHRWRRHACPRVIVRATTDQPRWFRWPRASTQLVVWVYLLGAITVLVALKSLSA